ncbi:hypothetical protein [Aureibaculum marinum]|nr:hypothetical protein [Aureibaculum marinum]
MKKLAFLLVIFMLSVVSLDAFNLEKSDKLDKNFNDIKIVETEMVVKNMNSTEIMVVRKVYRGRCLDGTTFTFTASNYDEAQGFVNGYCAARREMAAME